MAKYPGLELVTLAGRPRLVVERFDRDAETWPHRRLHQEDLCQALGLTPCIDMIRTPRLAQASAPPRLLGSTHALHFA